MILRYLGVSERQRYISYIDAVGCLFTLLLSFERSGLCHSRKKGCFKLVSSSCHSVKMRYKAVGSCHGWNRSQRRSLTVPCRLYISTPRYSHCADSCYQRQSSPPPCRRRCRTCAESSHPRQSPTLTRHPGVSTLLRECCVQPSYSYLRSDARRRGSQHGAPPSKYRLTRSRWRPMSP